MNGEAKKDCKDYIDQRIKHLEMIQGVIGRYLNFSAQVKNLAILIGWTVFLGVMVGGISIFSETESFLGIKKIVGAIFLFTILELITILCFVLDMYYFLQGEAFREFYDRVRAQPSGQRPNFCMTVPSDITVTAFSDVTIPVFSNVTVSNILNVFRFYGAVIFKSRILFMAARHKKSFMPMFAFYITVLCYYAVLILAALFLSLVMG